MEIVHPRCAGLDVHKRSIMACVSLWQLEGKAHKEVRQFGTMSDDIFELGAWLDKMGVTHVVMESTGVYWKPIFNLLEESFTLLLANAKHYKNVPGRKTDVKDCEWLADLLQHGLMKASFVPPRPHRELRELTRQRVQLTKEKNAAINRVEKQLEDANIKLGAVATDIMGKSGRDILQGLIDGQASAEELAERARGKLRSKLSELERALRGGVTEHHRFMLSMLLAHIDHIDALIARLDERIEHRMNEIDQETASNPAKEGDAVVVPFEVAVELLDTIPGIDVVGARAIVAEIGTDMSRFPTAGDLASWAGVCPGNNTSAGKRRSGKTTGGNRWLKRALGNAATSAGRTKNTYLATQYARLARGGKNKAIVAVAHTILTTIHAMLRDGTPYEDLGADFFDNINRDRRIHYYRKRLEALGYAVDIREKAA